MKIYLYNPETGVYQGEDFADDLPMCEGREAVPAHATAIAPPPCGRKEAPFFRATENQWEIRPVSTLVTGSGAGPA
jgi:hypothetical protein